MITGAKVKTDRRDASKLAKYLRLGELPEAYIYPKEKRPLRDLLRRRSDLVQLRASCYTSLRVQLLQYNLNTFNGQQLKQLASEDIDHGGIHLTGVRRDPHQCSAADRHGRFAPGRSRLVGCPRRLGGSGGSFPGRRLAMRSWKRIGSWATASSSTR